MRAAVVVLWTAGVAAGLARDAVAQSLAEVAQKEAERRKDITEPSKVFTNKDLATVPPTAPPESIKPAGNTAEKSGTEQPQAPGGQTEPVKDQAYWSDRIKQLRTQVDRDQTYAQALQTQINSLTTDFVNRDDPAQRNVIELDRQKTLAELDRLKQAIVADKKAIDDCQEEARRAGVPPGWLRD
jgi:hypothetical protein